METPFRMAEVEMPVTVCLAQTADGLAQLELQTAMTPLPTAMTWFWSATATACRAPVAGYPVSTPHVCLVDPQPAVHTRTAPFEPLAPTAQPAVLLCMETPDRVIDGNEAVIVQLALGLVHGQPAQDQMTALPVALSLPTTVGVPLTSDTPVRVVVLVGCVPVTAFQVAP